VFKPTFAISTPVEILLPDSMTGNRGIRALVHSHATEYNPLSRNPYYRTAAPYPYTNNCGTAFAVLVPCVVAYLSSVRTGVLRVALLVSLPFALVPAFWTLNRGMFIGLGAGLVYLGLRALLRGDVRLIASIGAVGALVWVATLVIPVGDLISNRVENTDSTRDRADLFAFFTLVAWRLAAAVSAPGRWLSVVPVIALVITPFYGFTDVNLSLMFFSIGLGLAAIDGPVNRDPEAVQAGPGGGAGARLA
jgi:hypothetical protein